MKKITRKRIYRIIGTMLLLGLISFLGYKGVKKVQYENQLNQFLEETEFKNGDLIFRRGKSIPSFAVIISDKNSGYSHVGMIQVDNGDVMVIHAVPDESEGEAEYVKCEAVSSFLDYKKCSRAALYRLKNWDPDITNDVVAFAEAAYNAKYEFDHKYDLNSEDKIYCTELVWKAYKRSKIDLVDGHFDFLRAPTMYGEFILPGSFLQSRFLTRVNEF